MSVFEPLISLSREPLTEKDLTWIVQTLHTEKNDSSVAIIGGVFAESALRQAVLSRLRESKTENRELFRRNAPLSTFDALILMGFALSIYGKEYRHDLEAIRHIRNAFAHVPRAISFETKQVSDVCNTLNALKVASKFNEDPKTAREKYGFTVRTVSIFLIMASGVPSHPEPHGLP